MRILVTSCSMIFKSLTIEFWVRINSLPAGQVKRFVTIQPGEGGDSVPTVQNGPGQLHFYMNINGALRSIRINNILQTDPIIISLARTMV